MDNILTDIIIVYILTQVPMVIGLAGAPGHSAQQTVVSPAVGTVTTPLPVMEDTSALVWTRTARSVQETSAGAGGWSRPRWAR